MHPQMYRRPWDCEAARQQQEPMKRPKFEKYNDDEPTERDMKFRERRKFRHNDHREVME